MAIQQNPANYQEEEKNDAEGNEPLDDQQEFANAANNNNDGQENL